MTSSSSPHILHVTTVPTSLMFIEGQLAFMQQRGLRISCLTSPGEGLDAFSARTGVTVHTVEMPRKISPLQDLLALQKIINEINSIKPDIVHAHTPKGGLLGMLGATLARVPHRVYHMRGLPFMTAHATRRALLLSTEALSCALAQRVICVSHSLRQVALDHHLVSSDKIAVMAGGSGQGVDALGRFDPARPGLAEARAQVRAALDIPPDALVLGFIGRLVRDKGVTELATAWHHLHHHFPHAHLLIVGDYEPRDPVPEATRELLATLPRVHMAGWQRDTPRFYAAMDLVTLPTYREGFPNVPLEAAAMGLPVIATRIPGCVDAVADGRTGTLVPAADAHALQLALERYLADDALRHEHGEAGRQRVLDQFLPERIYEEIFGVYQALLGAE